MVFKDLKLQYRPHLIIFNITMKLLEYNYATCSKGSILGGTITTLFLPEVFAP